MLSSVKIVSLESQTLLRTPCSGEFQNGYFSLPLLEDKRDFFFFSGVHYEKLVELLKVKLIKVWGPHCDWVPGDFISQVSPNWASNNSWTTAQVFLTLVLVPVEVGFCAAKLGSPYLPVCLSNLHGGLSCDITSLADRKRIVDFSFFFSFLLVLRAEWPLLSSLPAELKTKVFNIQFAKNFASFILTATHHIYSVHTKVLTLLPLSTTWFSTLFCPHTCCPAFWTCTCLIVITFSETCSQGKVPGKVSWSPFSKRFFQPSFLSKLTTDGFIYSKLYLIVYLMYSHCIRMML